MHRNGNRAQADAEALYRLLEDEVAPLFYQRNNDNVPQGWVAMMKDAIRTVEPQFSTRRMIKEYARDYYAPAMSDVIALEGGLEGLNFSATGYRAALRAARSVLNLMTSLEIRHATLADVPGITAVHCSTVTVWRDPVTRAAVPHAQTDVFGRWRNGGPG